jgi:hypothetical protein
MSGLYERDEKHIKNYAKDSKDELLVKDYLKKWIHNTKNHKEYLDLVTKKRLDSLRIGRSK